MVSRMKVESQAGVFSVDILPTKADVQALKIIISGLAEQIMEIQGHLNLDSAELHALKQMNNAASPSEVQPNPVLVAQFFTNARRSN